MNKPAKDDKSVNPILTNPRRTLIKRLFHVWLLMTVVSSGLVTLSGFMRINSHIIDILKTDSEQSRVLFRDFEASGSPITKAKLETEIKKLLSQSFVRIQLYNEKMQPLMDLYEGDSKKIREITDQYDSYLSENLELKWKRFRSDGSEYVVLMAPILDDAGLTLGYFKAAYRISEAMISSLKGMIFLVDGIIAFIILIVLIIVYPIVFQLNKGLLDTSRELLHSNIGMLKTLGSAIAIRDNDTSLHNYRVTISSIVFAEEIGLNEDETRRLIIGALLHDIGKIGIPDSILLKNDRLNDDEFAIMTGHVDNGLGIIEKYSWLKYGEDVVGCHHEKFDGSGYPNGLKDGEIPLIARMFAIIDVFDALISSRPYKRAFTFDETMKIITEKAGSHFDPKLVESFLSISDNIYDICTYLDETKADYELAEMVKRYFPEIGSAVPNSEV